MRTMRSAVSMGSSRPEQPMHVPSSSPGLHENGQPRTTTSEGSTPASARTAVDFAVPLLPRTSTPPMRGLTAFSSSARFIGSCATIALNGNRGSVVSGSIPCIIQNSIPGCARIPCSRKGCLTSDISVTRSAYSTSCVGA